MVTDDDDKQLELYQNDMVNESKSLEKILMCSALFSSSCKSVLISVKNISGRHLLESWGDVLIASVDELAAGDVVCDLLRLPQLPGQWPLPCCHHLKGKSVHIPPLGRVVELQMLGHGASLFHMF